MSNSKFVVLADLTDMVFEDRERRYGAYWLRQNYRKHALLGLAIASGLMLVFSFWGHFAGKAESPENPYTEVVFAPTEIPALPEVPKEEIVKPPEMPDPPKVQQLEFLPPDPTPLELVDSTATMHSVDTLKLIQNFGTQDLEGDVIDPFAQMFVEGDEVITDVIVDKKELKPDTFVWVDEEPRPINMDEISRVVEYPTILRDARIEGTVVMRVLVDKRGQYVKHIVINSPHPMLTDEVAEHVDKLQFTPAIQGGKPITFWVNIPFSFQLLN